MSQRPILFPTRALGILFLGFFSACSGSKSAPSITSQPESVTTVVGRSAELEAGVKGKPTPDLVWQKDGVNISSQTESTCTISDPKLTDAGGYTVYASNSLGSVTSEIATLTVLPVPTLYRPFGIAVDSAKTLYVSDATRHTISKLVPNSDGTVTQSLLAGSDGISGSEDKSGSSASFNSPEGLALDASGNLYVADYGNHTIRKIDTLGAVTTFAGQAEASGTVDGDRLSARFNHPIGLAFNASYSVLYVADSGNHTIRAINIKSQTVSTFAGTAGSPGTSSSMLSSPNGVAVSTSDDVDTLYVTDYGSSTIRKITSSGGISTLAGYAGDTGTANGTGNSARFNQPVGITLHTSGYLLVADAYNHAIRKVSTSGSASTLAGESGVSGNEDESGSEAHFSRPSNICVDSSGIAYVTDYKNGLIRTITTAGVVGTLTSPVE